MKLFGYHPKMFWDIWSLDFDKENERTFLHPCDIQAFELIKEINPDSILEIGCAFGRNLRELVATGFNPVKLCGVDISRQMLKKCKRYLGNLPVRLQCADVTSLPFIDNSYDVVYVSFVLMHVPQHNVIEGIKEALRVANKRVVFIEEYRPVEDYIGTKQINEYTYAHNYRYYLRAMGYNPLKWNVIDKWCFFAVDL